MNEEPVKHIARPPLPWRDPALVDTECGRPSQDFAAVVSQAEAAAEVKRDGIQRARYGFCMTCIDRLRWDGLTAWDTNPSKRLGREIGHHRREALLNKELRALAELATQHADEFRALVEERLVPIGNIQRKSRRGMNP